MKTSPPTLDLKVTEVAHRLNGLRRYYATTLRSAETDEAFTITGRHWPVGTRIICKFELDPIQNDYP